MLSDTYNNYHDAQCLVEFTVATACAFSIHKLLGMLTIKSG